MAIYVRCDASEILRLIAAGQLDASALITHTYPLREAPAAYDLFAAHRDGVMKIALDCRNASEKANENGNTAIKMPI